MKSASVVIACEVKTGQATPRRVYFLGETPAEVAALERLWQALIRKPACTGATSSPPPDGHRDDAA